MVVGSSELLLCKYIGDERYYIAVFGVQHCRHTERPCAHHYIENGSVSELHWVVGHVDLDRGDAIFDKDRKLLIDNVFGGIGKDQMEAIVAV